MSSILAPQNAAWCVACAPAEPGFRPNKNHGEKRCQHAAIWYVCVFPKEIHHINHKIKRDKNTYPHYIHVYVFWFEGHMLSLYLFSNSPAALLIGMRSVLYRDPPRSMRSRKASSRARFLKVASRNISIFLQGWAPFIGSLNKGSG